MEFEMINCNCPSRQLSEDAQEYYDKMYGRPSTDMYEFITLTEDELKEKNILYGWRSKKKENITEDSKIKRIRTEYFGWGYKDQYNCVTNIVENNNNFINHIEENIKMDRDSLLFKEILK